MQQSIRQYKSAMEIYVASEMLFNEEWKGKADQDQNEMMQRWYNEPKELKKKYHNALQASKKQTHQQLHAPIELPLYPLTPYEKFFIEKMEKEREAHPQDFPIHIDRQYQGLDDQIRKQMDLDYKEEYKNYMVEVDRLIMEKTQFK